MEYGASDDGPSVERAIVAPSVGARSRARCSKGHRTSARAAGRTRPRPTRRRSGRRTPRSGSWRRRQSPARLSRPHWGKGPHLDVTKAQARARQVRCGMIQRHHRRLSVRALIYSGESCRATQGRDPGRLSPARRRRGAGKPFGLAAATYRAGSGSRICVGNCGARSRSNQTAAIGRAPHTSANDKAVTSAQCVLRFAGRRARAARPADGGRPAHLRATNFGTCR